MFVARTSRAFNITLVGAIFALSGCGGNITNDIRVRTFNAYIPAPGADGSLNFVSGTTSLSGGTAVAFAQLGNGGRYSTVPNNSFAPYASGPGTTSSIVFQVPFTLLGNSTAYTIIAIGQSGQSGTLLPQLIATRNYTPDQLALTASNAAIRVINLSLNPNPIGLYTTTGGVPSAALVSGVGSVAYGFDPSTNTYVSVAADQVANLALVDTTATGTALTLSQSSNLNSMVLFAGQAYTLYIYGQPGNSSQPLGATWVLDYPSL